MSDYTPTTGDPRLDDLRSWYIEGRRTHNPFASDADLVVRFDRAYAELIQEAKAEALREAATKLLECREEMWNGNMRRVYGFTRAAVFLNQWAAETEARHDT